MLKLLREYKTKCVYPVHSVTLSKLDLQDDLLYIPKVSIDFINSLTNIFQINIGKLIIYTSIKDQAAQKRLAKFCYFFSTFIENTFQNAIKHKNLIIYYLPDPNLGIKEIKDISKTLSPFEVNSGLNFGNKIVVYRKQEAAKVLIHELVHAYGLDRGIQATLPPGFSINSTVPIRFTETYTELLASILFVEFVRKNPSQEAAFSQLFNHFDTQANKVMCIFYKNTKKSFVQETHVFEYIIAKAAICNYFLSDIKRIENVLIAPKDIFSKHLTRAIVAYIDKYSCSLRAIPKTI